MRHDHVLLIKHGLYLGPKRLLDLLQFVQRRFAVENLCFRLQNPLVTPKFNAIKILMGLGLSNFALTVDG